MLDHWLTTIRYTVQHQYLKPYKGSWVFDILQCPDNSLFIQCPLQYENNYSYFANYKRSLSQQMISSIPDSMCYRNILCQAHKQDTSIQNHTKTCTKQKSNRGSCTKKMWNEPCWEYLHLNFSTPKDFLPCPMEHILVPFVQRFQYILKYFWEKDPALSYICISGASPLGIRMVISVVRNKADASVCFIKIETLAPGCLVY